MLRKLITLSLLLLLLPLMATAQKSNIEAPVSHLSKNKLERYRKDSRFFYVNTKENQPDFYDSYGKFILTLLKKIFGNRAAFFVFSHLDIIILVIALIIIYLYFRKTHFNTLNFKNKNIDTSILALQDKDIHEINFDKLIAKALKDKDYKLAIRYQYLNMLKRLNEAELIHWQAYKTNFDYYLEIKPRELKEHFRELSILFEYVWYGKSSIQQEDYNEIEQEYKDLTI